MRISLNLATRPFADMGPVLRRLRLGMLVLVLISAGALLGLHAVHNRAEAARARAHSLDGAIAHASSERQGYLRMMQEPDNARLLDETRALNQLFDEKAFSWTLTMESLETVLPGGVQVSTLEPLREADGHIMLRMRVIGPRDKGIEFVRNLEHSRRFLLPRIVGETAENLNGPGQNLQPVSDTNRFSFDLVADYNPPSATEIKNIDHAGKTPSAPKDGKSAAPTGQGTPTSATGQTRTRHDYRSPARPLPEPRPAFHPMPGGAR